MHERKHATVLFADLCSSTEQVASVDLEDAQGLLERVLRLMREAVELYGGTLSQMLGDGVLALFGAPRAQEDHALRACLAATEMQRRTRTEDGGERQMQIRVGINSGELLVGTASEYLTSHYRADGVVLHLAARLEQLARPGTVLIGEATARLVQSELGLLPRGQHHLRGLPDAIAVFELLTDAGHSVAAPLARRSRLGPMVGREQALAALTATATQATGGALRMVGLRGEAGVGKTRLLSALIEAAPGLGLRTLCVTAQAYTSEQPFRLIANLIRALLALEDAMPAELEPQHADAIADLLELTPVGAAWRALTPGQRRKRIGDALRWQIEHALSAGPLLIVLEDLAQADPDSLRLLESLLRNLTERPLLLCASYRPEFAHRWLPSAWFTEQWLAPLPTAEMTRLAGILLGEHESLGPLLATLVERADGNPLFLEQLILTLVDESRLIGTPGAYRCLRAPEALSVPGTIAAIIGARMDRLPGAVKRCLESASVLGEPISAELVAMMQGIEPAEAGRHLLKAEAAGLLNTLDDGVCYGFQHALVQQSIQEMLTRSRRRLLHRAAFSALRNSSAGLPADGAAVLVQHAWRGEAWDEAAEFAQRSIARSIARSANRDALRLFELGLDAARRIATAATAQARELGLRLEAMAALLPLGQAEAAIANLERARQLAQSLGDQRHEAGILLQLALILWTRASYRQGLEAVAAAEAMALTSGSRSAQMAALQVQMKLRHGLGEYAEVERLSLRTENEYSPELATRQLLPRWVVIASVNCRAFRADALWRMGRVEPAQVCCELAYAELAQHDHAFSRALLDFVQADVWCAAQRPAEAVALLHETLANCRDNDLPTMYPAIVASLGGALAQDGRAAEARTLLERAIADKAALAGGRYNDFYFPYQLARALAGCAEPEAALNSACVALAAASALEQRGHQVQAHALIAELAEQTGDGQLACTHYEQAADLGRQTGMAPLAAQAEAALRRLGSDVAVPAERRT